MFSFFAKLFYDVYVLQILLYPYFPFRSYILHYARKILSNCLLHLLQRTITLYFTRIIYYTSDKERILERTKRDTELALQTRLATFAASES